MLTTILQGGADKAKEAGIPTVGGHSVDDKEPKYGLVVTGEIEEKNIVTNKSATPGDVLVLTKPLGTGIIATAIKKGVVKNDVIRAAVESMSALNELASKIMVELGVKTATDVSGFGLLGHLNEICEASKVSAEIKYNVLPLLPGVNKLASDGIIPGGTKRNLSFATSFTYFHDQLTKIQQLISADAQTSGGLLISLSPDSAKMFIKKFNERSPIKAQKIGNIIKQKTNTIYVT
jgi:selenide,water dikinase